MDAEYGRSDIQRDLERFARDVDAEEMSLPPFGSMDRKWVHKLALKMGLHSKSHGAKDKRYIVVRKKKFGADSGRISSRLTSTLNLHPDSTRILQQFSSTKPPNAATTQELLRRSAEVSAAPSVVRVPDRLTFSGPKVPKHPFWNHLRRSLMSVRSELPIMPYRQMILEAVRNNSVTLIVGETGSGKSTQVPQFILEDATTNNAKCRIICTEPRRVAAITVAERCANERGEDVGHTVGYQIRLEKMLDPAHTLLTFCTNGVFLRSLIGQQHILKNVTHIIVDEVHERDRMSDFLLTILRELLVNYKHVRLILMSASLEVERFRAYFPQSFVVEVPGRNFFVEEYFLEDVLKLTNYRSKTKFGFGFVNEEEAGDQAKSDTVTLSFNKQSQLAGAFGEGDISTSFEKLSVAEADELIADTFLNGGLFAFDRLIKQIERGALDVNYKHSRSGMSTLALVAARNGMKDQLFTLLNLGAVDVEFAKALAYDFGQREVFQHFAEYDRIKEEELARSLEVKPEETEAQKTLRSYFGAFFEDQVDCNLIVELIHYILTTSELGAILVFLPGYEDIMTVRDILSNDERFLNKLTVCILHSLMMPSDQKEAFQPAADGLRKIVLSTNIAEVSVTIEDVIFVIDTGKMKERLFDGNTGISMLCNVWISKANALQRKGRAGRCCDGVCFRLYTRSRFESMPSNQVPEMLRVPIHELCLQTKLLFPGCESVEQILSRAPDPPSRMILRSSISLLKTIGAMTPDEQLTSLGRKLCELPVDPQFAKILLYSILFRCVDAALIVVASLSYKEPFILPKLREEKNAAMEARCGLGIEGFSDHLVLYRAFDGWLRASRNKHDRQFCSQNFLSSSSLNMIYGIREQIRIQLERLGYIGNNRSENNYDTFNVNSNNWSVVKAVLVAGCYPSLALIDREKGKIRTKSETVDLSIYSTLASRKNGRVNAKDLDQIPTDWLIFNELMRVRNQVQIKCLTAVTPISVALFAGAVHLVADDSMTSVIEQANLECWDEEEECEAGSSDTKVKPNVVLGLRIDESILLKMDAQSAKEVMNLREHVHTLFLRLLRVPWATISEEDEYVLKSVVDLLTREDEQCGLTLPVSEQSVRTPTAQIRHNPRSFYKKPNRKK